MIMAILSDSYGFVADKGSMAIIQYCIFILPFYTKM